MDPKYAEIKMLRARGHIASASLTAARKQRDASDTEFNKFLYRIAL